MKHIVYVVGAGLTKALQKTAPIPLMDDFVSVMADYIYDDNGDYDRTVLTGLAELENAGVFENTKEDWKSLAQRVVLSARKTEPNLTREEAETFRKIMQERCKENIEGLLQRALENDHIRAEPLPQRFNWAINKVFSRIGWNVNLVCLEKFLTRQFDLPHTKHTFVSFNYDLVLDSLIQRQSKLSWDVKSGYGFAVEHFFTPEAASEHMRQFPAERVGFVSYLGVTRLTPSVSSDTSVLILKPHGSLNWLLGFEGNYKFFDEIPILCLNSDHSIAYYPHSDCNNLRFVNEIPWNPSEGDIWVSAGLFIIPPANSKTREMGFLKSIRQQEKEAYRTADEIYIIGWSLPPTDKDQANLIRKCFRERQKPIERVTVVNYCAGQGYYDYLESICNVDRRRMHNHDYGFCQYVSGLYS